MGWVEDEAIIVTVAMERSGLESTGVYDGLGVAVKTNKDDSSDTLGPAMEEEAYRELSDSIEQGRKRRSDNRVRRRQLRNAYNCRV